MSRLGLYTDLTLPVTHNSESEVKLTIPFSASAHFLMMDDSHSLSFFISALVATTIIGNYKQAFDPIKDINKQYECLDRQLFLDDE